MSGTKTLIGRCAAAGVVTGLALLAGPAVGSAVAAPDPGITALAKAVKATAAAGSAKVALHEEVQAAGRTVTLVADGASNFAKHTSQLTAQLPQGGSLEVRTIGTTEYLKLPAAAGNQLGVKTPWVKIDLTKVAGANQMGSSLGSATPQDPSQVLGYLQAATSVTKVGSGSVNGTPTTQYKVKVDVAKLAAAQGASPQQLDQIKQALGAKPVAIRVWIDKQHLIRQEKLAIPVSTQAAGGTSGQVSLTLSLSDFGAPVNVTAPPASQTTDITAQLAQLVQSAQNGGQVQMPAGGVATGNGSTAGVEHQGLLFIGGGALLAGLALGGTLIARRRQYA